MPEQNKKEEMKEKINKFLIDYFFWVNLSIVFIVLLSGAWLFIVPKYQKVVMKTVSPKIEMEEKYSAKSSDLAKIEKLISAYNNVSQKDKDKVYLIIPDKPEEEELIREMEVIAQKSGLILESVRVEKVEEKTSIKTTYFNQPKGDETVKKLPQGIGTVEIEMNLIGTSYYTLKELLRIIESYPRLLDINEINFDPDKETTRLKITTYYIKS